MLFRSFIRLDSDDIIMFKVISKLYFVKNAYNFILSLTVGDFSMTSRLSLRPYKRYFKKQFIFESGPQTYSKRYVVRLSKIIFI